MIKSLFSLLLLSASICLNGAYAQSNNLNDLMAVYAEEGHENRIQSPFNGAVLVAKNNKILLKQAYGFSNKSSAKPLSVNSKFLIGSVTKQFTAMLALQQVAEGTLALDKSIVHYLPYFPKDKGQPLTIHRLLSHTSGLPHYEGIRRLGITMDDFSNRKLTPEEYALLIADMEPINKPGTEFYYSSMNYVLLGAVLEAVTKRPYAELLAEKIALPLKLTNTGFANNRYVNQQIVTGHQFREFGSFEGFFSDDQGHYSKAPLRDQSNTYSTGGIYSTVDDLYRWTKAVKNSELLPQNLTQKMLSPGLGGYGYGWFVNHENLIRFAPHAKVISHSGSLPGFASTVAMYEDDVTVIYLTNVAPIGDIRLTMNLHLAANGVDPEDYKRDIRLPVMHRELEDFEASGGLNALTAYYDEISRRAGYRVHLTQWGYEELTQLYTQAKRPEEANRIVKEMLSFYSTPDKSHLNEIGYHFLEQGYFDYAIHYLTINRDNYAYSASAHESLGDAYFQKGDYINAVKQFEKALQLAQKNNSRHIDFYQQQLLMAEEKLRS